MEYYSSRTVFDPIVTPLAYPLVGTGCPPGPTNPTGDTKAPQTFEPWEIALTDAGNADRFTDQHCANARYCTELRSWFLWTGQHWEEDRSEQIIQLGELTAKSIFGEAKAIERGDRRNKLESWALRSCNRHGINNMLHQAQPKMALLSSQLDQDRCLLNCANGTLDLKTGQLRTHRREDWITKLVPVSYEEGARCDQFLSFLDRITDGDKELETYLQRALGYSLTGRMDEQCWFIAYGSGANGKSTLLNLFGKLLGDYSRNAAVHTFVQKKFEGGAREDLVRLRGARFVTIMEAEENQKLAASLLKQITGGDAVTARDLYKGSIEFDAQMKPWLATNHKPKLEGSDAAIWRRVKLIPFNVVVPENERDPELPSKLWREAPGILAWAVRGALDWQATGLKAPEAVNKATDSYRSEMDDVRRFVDQCLEMKPEGTVSKKFMFDMYQKWARDSEINILSKVELTRRLKAAGLVDGKSNNERLWKGVSIFYDQLQFGRD